MATKLIGHLDADCFYVSAERVRHPLLKNQPVGVLGNQGACIIAKSYELKRHGITTGMPIWEALPRCPSAIYVKRDFRWYEVLSRKMLAILQQVSPTVEYYSIDEMFFDAGELEQVFRCPIEAAMRELQQRLLIDVGIPVSIGVSPSKCLAKLASDARKPFGCTLLTDREIIDQFLSGLDVSELWGIGKRSADKLRSHGITTCLEFARSERLLIQRLLTVKGEGIWWELNGESVLPIQTARPAHQRISRGGSLGGSIDDAARLNAWVIRNTERLFEELDFHQVRTSRLILSLAYRERTGSARRVTLPLPTNDFDVIAAYAVALFQSAWDHSSAVSYMHLEAEQLEPNASQQLRLFEWGATSRVADVKRQINQKIGRFALRSAATLAIEEVYADESNDYDICDVHGKMCFLLAAV